MKLQIDTKEDLVFVKQEIKEFALKNIPVESCSKVALASGLEEKAVSEALGKSVSKVRIQIELLNH